MICAFVTPLQLQIRAASGTACGCAGATAIARNSSSARSSGTRVDSLYTRRSDGTIAPSPMTMAPTSLLLRTTSFL